MCPCCVVLCCVVAQHEGSECADRADGEALQRSHSQLPYFLGRPAQDHAVIKSGYCVKQGAVVSCVAVFLKRHPVAAGYYPTSPLSR